MNMPADKACQHIGDHAMVKLHGQMTFKEIEPERLHIKQTGGNEIAVHKRPIRIGFTGIDTRDQRPKQRLHQHRNNDNRSNDGLFAETTAFGCAAPIIQRQPKRGSEDNQGQPQMHGKAILADIDPLSEAAGHHIPTHKTLQTAQSKQAEQRR